MRKTALVGDNLVRPLTTGRVVSAHPHLKHVKHFKHFKHFKLGPQRLLATTFAILESKPCFGLPATLALLIVVVGEIRAFVFGFSASALGWAATARLRTVLVGIRFGLPPGTVGTVGNVGIVGALRPNTEVVVIEAFVADDACGNDVPFVVEVLEIVAEFPSLFTFEPELNTATVGAGAPNPACRLDESTVGPGDEVGPAAFDAAATVVVVVVVGSGAATSKPAWGTGIGGRADGIGSMSVPAGVFTNVVVGFAVVVVVVLVGALVATGADVAAGGLVVVVVVGGAVVLEGVVDVVLLEVVLVEVVLVVELLGVLVVELLGVLDVVDAFGAFGVVVLEAPAFGCVVVVVELFDPLGCVLVVLDGLDGLVVLVEGEVVLVAGEVVELLEAGTVVEAAVVEGTAVDATVGATVVATIDVVALVVVVVAAAPTVVNSERSAWVAPRICAGSAPSQPESTDAYTRRKSNDGTRF